MIFSVFLLTSIFGTAAGWGAISITKSHDVECQAVHHDASPYTAAFVQFESPVMDERTHQPLASVILEKHDRPKETYIAELKVDSRFRDETGRRLVRYQCHLRNSAGGYFQLDTLDELEGIGRLVLKSGESSYPRVVAFRCRFNATHR